MELPNASPQVQAAAMDLSKRLSIPLDQIEVVGMEAVVWPDASMGCPQPGMVYAQVQVDGARIRLRAAGQDYAYHSGGARPPFLCEQPGGAAPTTPIPSAQS